MTKRADNSTHDRLLTVAEVAERLNASERSVRRLIKANELKILRISGMIRIREADLQDALARWQN